MQMNEYPKFKETRKIKVDKKRLFFVFFVAFMVFFFLSTIIVSLLSPSIDIPAMKNNDDFGSISSDDFKGRIDPRLKSLESQEEVGNQTSENALQDKSKQNANQVQKSTGNEQFQYLDDGTYDPNSPNAVIYEDANNYDNNGNPVGSTPIKTASANKQVKPTDKQSVLKQGASLTLREKVNVDRVQSGMTRVMVGSYSNPDDARKASDDISKSNPNLYPFIRENNGNYSLQVGSFSDPQKAESFANDLKRKSLNPVIVRD
jgi:hypothetical protein